MPLPRRVAEVVSGGGGVLVLHEHADAAWWQAVLPPAGAPVEVLVVVGPEGGITDAELSVLVAAGASPSGSALRCCAARRPARPPSQCCPRAWVAGTDGSLELTGRWN